MTVHEKKSTLSMIQDKAEIVKFLIAFFNFRKIKAHANSLPNKTQN